MEQAGPEQFASRVEDHLFGHLLPFWMGPAVDPKNGGWMSWMSNDLRIDRSQPKGLIVHSRILWAFSAAWQARPGAALEQMARRALDYLAARFWDPDFGGAFWRLTDDGRVFDDLKKTYGQAFVIYAFSEFARAFGDAPALERAQALFRLLDQHAHDPEHGGYWEARRRDWSPAIGARLSEKDLDAPKSMNNHLHVLEACASLYRVWPEPLVAERLRELIDLFALRILDPRTFHLHHFFGKDWQVRSDSYTFGHDIEASWLLCEAAEVLGDRALIDRCRRLAVEMAKRVLSEGLEDEGGLCYEGRGGEVIDQGKECWPQAEAVVGFINAWQISGNARFLRAAGSVWEYIERHLADRVNGEWFWRIGPDGLVDPTLPKVSEWKGPYHATRACLEAARRLREGCHPVLTS